MLTKTRRELRLSLVIKGHKRTVECGVPESRQKKAVVYVEPFGITSALAPRDDVRGAQKGRIERAL